MHVKIYVKVKNKKRWSQVMYMSYVLDFKEKIMEGLLLSKLLTLEYRIIIFKVYFNSVG